ncbi:MAG TPA: DUF5985 family protein [Sphingomicrobium sp.]|jgi:hypothetical protein|nr:DUF5985 family protein [Sphingomicrobium sp.]
MADVFPTAVYILCFLTSGACAWLLGRSYGRSRTPLLLWSSVSFVFLALNNLLLVLDLVVWPSPEVDLRLPRLLLALAASCSLLFGFIYRIEEE